MILPSVIKVSVTALEAVPKEYEDASLALGATKIETFFRVSVPGRKKRNCGRHCFGCRTCDRGSNGGDDGCRKCCQYAVFV